MFKEMSISYEERRERFFGREKIFDRAARGCFLRYFQSMNDPERIVVVGKGIIILQTYLFFFEKDCFYALRRVAGDDEYRDFRNVSGRPDCIEKEKYLIDFYEKIFPNFI